MKQSSIEDPFENDRDDDLLNDSGRSGSDDELPPTPPRPSTPQLSTPRILPWKPKVRYKSFYRILQNGDIRQDGRINSCPVHHLQIIAVMVSIMEDRSSHNKHRVAMKYSDGKLRFSFMRIAHVSVLSFVICCTDYVKFKSPVH